MNSHRMIGPYQVLEELGRGGMGAVYRARDPRGGPDIAVKVLLPGGQADAKRRRRFAREVEALKRLQHPNVVEVLDAGMEGSQPWLAMRFVPGQTLQDLLRAGPLDLDDATRLASDLGAALCAAHEAGLLHRDVKPDNVLCDLGTGRFLLTDFGLVRDVELAESRRLSLTGAIQGTPGYWAPEQAAGVQTGPWTDVYGFGATLYAALSGLAPIRGSSFIEILSATRDTPPERLRSFRSDLPPRLERAILRSLAKRPEDRFASVAAMLEELAAAPAVPLRRRTLALGAVVAVLVVLAVALAVRSTPSPSEGSPGVATLASRAPQPTRPARDLDALASSVAALRAAGRFSELFTLLESEAQAGLPTACYELGRMYHEGEGVQRDDVTALMWFRKAGAAVPAALSQIGRFHMEGLGGLERDAVAAVPYLKRAAAQGAPIAMINLGTLYLTGGGGLPRDLPRARRWFEQAASAGNTSAAVRVGEMHQRGIGTAVNPALAVTWYRKAATRGDPDGAFFLGGAYQTGAGVQRNPRLAVDWLKRAGAKSHPTALAALGELYARGVSVPPDPRASQDYYRRASEAGHPRAMHELSRLYLYGTKQEDLATSGAWLHKAAVAGYPRAMLDLAFLLAGQDRSAAEGWLRKARPALERGARNGEGMALTALGALVSSGIAGPANWRLAADYHRRAAEAGDPEGMVEYAMVLAKGTGVAKNLPEMIRWLVRASDMGFAPAMERYAVAHMEGLGVPKDVPQARAWMQRSAERGWPEGMYGLGLLHDTAYPDRARDPELAKTWLREAALRGHTFASLRLSAIHAGLRGDNPSPEKAAKWLEIVRPLVRADQPEMLRLLKAVEAALAKLKR